MKHLPVITVLVLSLGWSVKAAIIDASAFGSEGGLKWSEPVQISLESEFGFTFATKQTALVTDGIHSDVTIALVSNESTKGAYISQECEKYFNIGSEILGVRAEGSNLVFNHSSIDSSLAGTSALAAKLGDLIERIHQQKDDQSTRKYSLFHIFSNFLYIRDPEKPLLSIASLDAGGGPPDGQSEIFSVDNASVKPTQLLIDITSNAKRKLQLTIDRQFNVVSALENGKSVRLLSYGQQSSNKSWSPPLRKKYLNRSGISAIPIRQRTISFDGQVNGSVCRMFAAWADDGKYWMGPLRCQLIEVNDSICGIMLNPNNRALLEVYRSSVNIPTDGNGVGAFEKKLEEFDKSSTGCSSVDTTQTTIDLANLYADFSDVSVRGLNLSSVNYKGNNIEIILLTSLPTIRLSVVLDTDLKPVAREVVKSSPNSLPK